MNNNLNSTASLHLLKPSERTSIKSTYTNSLALGPFILGAAATGLRLDDLAASTFAIYGKC